MKISKFIAGLTVCSAYAMLNLPATAQTTAEEIIVTGNLGEVPEDVSSLSQAVSYADLDLSTEQGRDVLRKRLRLTARYLCERLGESDVSSPLIPSCQDAAVRDAMERVETIEASFAPRGTTWVTPPAWQAPYPIEWETQDPHVHTGPVPTTDVSPPPPGPIGEKG